MREVGTQTSEYQESSAKPGKRSTKETARLGREIYEREIRHKVEEDNVGKVCAIDVDTGCWALGDDTVLPDEDVAVERLKAKQPQAINILLERVGYYALRSFGAGSLRRTD